MIPQQYHQLNPFPWDETLCVSCGYDPRDVYDGNDIVGTAWAWVIERKGQLCLTCALERASYLIRQYPTAIRWEGFK